MVLFTGNAGESASDTAGGIPEKPAHACHPKAGKRARYPGFIRLLCGSVKGNAEA